jgi:S-adenosylmethionine:tRNA ribosyltransferase-isomerase
MEFFDYDLPTNLIAQSPAERRDESRLIHCNRHTQSVFHRHFRDLPELLRPGDLLILNDTRVLPARLTGQREGSGGKWEGLFLAELPGNIWEMMCQTRRRPKPGSRIRIDGGDLVLELAGITDEGLWRVRPTQSGSAVELLSTYGKMPLPRYIRKGMAAPSDADRYQTIYATQPGAIAAPTAGLHFTPELLTQLAARGINRAFVTLHVGVGTFSPIRVDDFRLHKMHSEFGSLPSETAAAIAACRNRKGRIVAVGTTSVRVLETAASDGQIRAWSGQTNLYIYPPYRFQCVDALITNFHLPRSSLLLLVGAFAGDELIRRAYEEAIAARYRFFSYGDAMLIE